MKANKTKVESASTETAITGLKVCEINGQFTIYTARRHSDGSFVREGAPLGSAPTAEEASTLLTSLAPASLVKHKKQDIFIFGGDAEVTALFHSQYEKKVGEIVGAPEAPAPKAKATKAKAPSKKAPSKGKGRKVVA